MLINNKKEIIQLMKDVKTQYFPDIDEEITFKLRVDTSGAVTGRILFNTQPIQLILYCGDEKILERHYRIALVPIIAHELAHLINPVNPEREMEKRLPEKLFLLWQEARKANLLKCSMEGKNYGSS